MKPPRAASFLAFPLLLVVGVSPVHAQAPPEAPPEPGSGTVVTGTDDRVGVGSPVRVESGETIDGDAVGIGTRVEIDGTVGGDVVGIGSRVFVRGRVGGDVVGVGSHIELAPGETGAFDVAVPAEPAWNAVRVGIGWSPKPDDEAAEPERSRTAWSEPLPLADVKPPEDADGPQPVDP